MNSRKDKEIKLLGAQLVKFKKYLKSGNLEKIQNEPDIEILGDEESSENSGQIDGETQLTEKTGFYDNNDNNLNNVKLNNNKKDGEDNLGNENGNEDGNGENNEPENEEVDGDNIVSGENNEGPNTIENKSSVSHEED